MTTESRTVGRSPRSARPPSRLVYTGECNQTNADRFNASHWTLVHTHWATHQQHPSLSSAAACILSPASLKSRLRSRLTILLCALPGRLRCRSIRVTPAAPAVVYTSPSCCWLYVKGDQENSIFYFKWCLPTLAVADYTVSSQSKLITILYLQKVKM